MNALISPKPIGWSHWYSTRVLYWSQSHSIGWYRNHWCIFCVGFNHESKRIIIIWGRILFDMSQFYSIQEKNRSILSGGFIDVSKIMIILSTFFVDWFHHCIPTQIHVGVYFTPPYVRVNSNHWWYLNSSRGICRYIIVMEN